VFLGGTQDNGTLRYNTAACGATAAPCFYEFTAGDGGYSAFDAVHSKRYPTYVYGRLYRFSGDSYERCLLSYSANDTGFCTTAVQSSLFYSPIAISPSNPSRLYAGGTPYIYYTQTADTTATWNAWAPSGSTGYVTSMAEAKSDAQTLYAAYSYGSGGSAVYVTTNFGTNWATSAQKLPNRVITEVTVKTSVAGTAWATLSGYNTATPGAAGHVFLTQDYGATWQNISGNLPDVPVNGIEVDSRTSPSTLYVATDAGMFWSQDGGGTWAKANGLPNTVMTDVRVDTAADKLIVATHGRGAYTTPIPSTPPAITSFTPTSGPTGTVVTITGTSFSYLQGVTFNGVAAVYTKVSSTTIKATVPSSATTGPIRVTTSGGTATSSTNFTKT
jgi:hypothetical protein